MNSKHGMGLLAAAGVAVGVVGISMGGANGAPTVACAPVDSGTSASNAASNGAGGNGTGVGPAGPAGPTGPSGSDGTDGRTDGSGNGIIVLPDLALPDLPGVPVPVPPTVPSVPGTPSVPAVPSVPGGGSGSGSGGDSSSGERPFVDIRGNTTSVDVGDGAVQAPPNDGQVVVRSDELSRLLTIDGELNLGR